ncbi:UNVERIFIED_CONTAM: hypothetical protein FKN15_060460 [Acipenser sinensis]
MKKGYKSEAAIAGEVLRHWRQCSVTKGVQSAVATGQGSTTGIQAQFDRELGWQLVAPGGGSESSYTCMELLAGGH